MDRHLKDRLEEYLRCVGSDRPEDRAVVDDFLRRLDSADEETLRTVRRFEEHSRGLRTLRPPSGMAPKAGFYARVQERIEERRRASLWFQFLDQRFSRTLAYASLALLFALSATIFWSETPQPQYAQNPAHVIAEPERASSLGADQDRDRAVVLVDLVTYQDSLQ
jgi:hypothetical protein